MEKKLILLLLLAPSVLAGEVMLEVPFIYENNLVILYNSDEMKNVPIEFDVYVDDVIQRTYFESFASEGGEILIDLAEFEGQEVEVVMRGGEYSRNFGKFTPEAPIESETDQNAAVSLNTPQEKERLSTFEIVALLSFFAFLWLEYLNTRNN